METRSEVDVPKDPRSTRAKEQLREQAATVRQDLRELGRLTKDVAQEKLGEARETVGGYVDHGRKRATELEDRLEVYVREKPLKSLLIAGGVGMLFGFLLSRR